MARKDPYHKDGYVYDPEKKRAFKVKMEGKRIIPVGVDKNYSPTFLQSKPRKRKAKTILGPEDYR